MSEQYVNDKHGKMSKNINVVIDISKFDYKAAMKMIKHFNEMIDKFFKAQSTLIDRV